MLKDFSNETGSMLKIKGIVPNLINLKPGEHVRELGCGLG